MLVTPPRFLGKGARRRTFRIVPANRWIAAGCAVGVVLAIWLIYSHAGGDTSAGAAPAAPQVVTSKPLVRKLDSKLGFLGQFSAVDQVELRAQVGGTLAEIHFKDGDIVHAGDLLFVIDSRPYDIKLAQARAQLVTASAKLVLARQELRRANSLFQQQAGTAENLDQRTADQLSAQAAVEDAQAAIRDAQFDVTHCRITAPFTGRIGAHLASVGSLVAGSRAASSPTTLLATLVSLDPIHLDFDMSETDFQAYTQYRTQLRGTGADKVEIALNGETAYTRQGSLDFLNNVLDRSSGTLHARATVANPDLAITPGQFARVELVARPPVPTLLLPDAAVLPDQSEHLVMTLSDAGTVTPKHVEVGDLRGGLRVIRSGLSPNDHVIIDGIAYATPGTKVAARVGQIRYANDAGQD